MCAVGAAPASAGDRAAAAPTASRGCYPKGSTTIAQDEAGRFYSSGDGPNRRWYVCAFKQGTPRSGTPPPVGSFEPVDPSAKVSGRYVAFFVSCHFCRGPFSWVAVIDMVTGQTTDFERTGLSPARLSGRLVPPVLKPDGSVAWVTETNVNYGVTWYVNRHDATGTAIVDSGPRIDPHSLAAGGSWLYWTDAGSPRSASFH